jgi:hypothetical protein
VFEIERVNCTVLTGYFRKEADKIRLNRKDGMSNLSKHHLIAYKTRKLLWTLDMEEKFGPL